MMAIRFEHTEIVKMLFEKGADVNAKENDGNTALHWASVLEYAEIVKMLLAMGADVNVKNNKGNTALTQAIFFGHTKIVEILEEAEEKFIMDLTTKNERRR